MSDLKPCPFCNQDDIRQEYGAGSKAPYNDPYMICVDCGASVPGMAGTWNTCADLATERERRLVGALHRVGLAERDSGTTKQCQEARAALKEIEHE